MNPTNPYGLKADKVIQAVRASSDACDAVTGQALFSHGGTNSRSGTVADSRNVVSWYPMGDSGAIAVTTVWYYLGSHEIAEADVQRNSNFPWGIDADGEGPRLLKSRYDVRDIVTHETGHVCGLGDLYDYPYRDLTMYGYGSYGEVLKMSLQAGDIVGVQWLYGT